MYNYLTKDIKQEFESLSKSNKTIGVSIENFQIMKKYTINRLNLSSKEYWQELCLLILNG